ncbi:MAG: hypothetical protein ACRDJE_21525 [Dehalococcoidia bacterium]
MPDVSVEEAVTRNCQAMLTGNIAQIFSDMTPEAMAKLASQGGAAMAGSVPTFTSYDIVSREQDGDDHIYDVRFQGTQSFGVKARWREMDGAWKLVDFDGYQLNPAAETGESATEPSPS